MTRNLFSWAFPSLGVTAREEESSWQVMESLVLLQPGTGSVKTPLRMDLQPGHTLSVQPDFSLCCFVMARDVAVFSSSCSTTAAPVQVPAGNTGVLECVPASGCAERGWRKAEGGVSGGGTALRGGTRAGRPEQSRTRDSR